MKGIFFFLLTFLKNYNDIKLNLISKSGLSKLDFEFLLSLILTRVKLVSPELLETNKLEALEIAKSINDLDDLLFIACALTYSDSAIWSNDKDLKRQSKVKVMDTKEFLIFLQK